MQGLLECISNRSAFAVSCSRSADVTWLAYASPPSSAITHFSNLIIRANSSTIVICFCWITSSESAWFLGCLAFLLLFQLAQLLLKLWSHFSITRWQFDQRLIFYFSYGPSFSYIKGYSQFMILLFDSSFKNVRWLMIPLPLNRSRSSDKKNSIEAVLKQRPQFYRLNTLQVLLDYNIFLPSFLPL